MAYDGQGRRPFERASRSSHHHIITDPEVQALLADSWIPGTADVPINALTFARPDLATIAEIEHIVAIDGSVAEAVVRPDYPSSAVAFMQFGALSFRRSDLERLDRSPHPMPEDMQRLRTLERLKFAYPVRGMRLDTCVSLTDSVRTAIHRFFGTATIEGVRLADTLAWAVFEKYRPARSRCDKFYLSTDPTMPDRRGVELALSGMNDDYSFVSAADPEKRIFLTDVFRLHEIIDEEAGAGGIAAHLMGAVEQFLLLHVMRLIHEQLPTALSRCVFLRDGPLAFFGPTARLHERYRSAIEWMRASAQVNLVGVEKSGAFVDHARHIESYVPAGSALILDDDYIYRFIVPGERNPNDIYGRNAYYGRKIIYRATSGGMHVASIPTAIALADPVAGDLHSFDRVLACIDRLRCDMYDSALFPIALANKLVSLSAHPSQRILQRFAVSSVRGG